MDRLERAKRNVVIANRILAANRVLDAYGHVSVRHPLDPDKYLLARSLSPGIVDVDDSQMMRIGDIGICSCGHISIAVSGSGITEGSNGMGVHRVGDVGITNGPGTYVAVTGSGITDSE